MLPPTITSIIPPNFIPFTADSDPQPPVSLFPYPTPPDSPGSATTPDDDDDGDWGACPPSTFNQFGSHNPTRTTKHYFQAMLGIFAEDNGNLEWLAVLKLALYTSTELTTRQSDPAVPKLSTPCTTWRHISFQLLNNWFCVLNAHRYLFVTDSPLLTERLVESLDALKLLAASHGHRWHDKTLENEHLELSEAEAAALFRVVQRMLVARQGGVYAVVDPAVVLFLLWRMYLYTIENLKSMGKRGKEPGRDMGVEMGKGGGKGGREKANKRVPLGGITGNIHPPTPPPPLPGRKIPVRPKWVTTATAITKLTAGAKSSSPSSPLAFRSPSPAAPSTSMSNLTSSISRHLNLEPNPPGHTYPLTIYTLLNGNHTKYTTVRQLTTGTPYPQLIQSFAESVGITQLAQFSVGRLSRNQGGMLYRSLKKGWGVPVMPTVTAEEDWLEFLEEWVGAGEVPAGDLLGGNVLLVVDVR